MQLDETRAEVLHCSIRVLFTRSASAGGTSPRCIIVLEPSVGIRGPRPSKKLAVSRETSHRGDGQ